LFRPWEPLLPSSKTSIRTYPDQFQFKSSYFDRLAGTDAVRKAMERNDPGDQDLATWQNDLKGLKPQARFLLYP
jgi:hypothetical protein